MAAVISVVIRARDEAASLGRVLDLLAAQRVDEQVEVIVVDNASRDRTAEVAREHGARVIPFEAGRFTFGGALNIGCAAARGDVIVALSAHAFPTHDRWLARVRKHFSDPLVACVSGRLRGPDGEPLSEPLVAGEDLLREHPGWGYSNGEGAVRAELWRAYPFRWDMPGTEDKEWAWHWAQRGHLLVVDPELALDHPHDHEGVRACFRRCEREARGFAMYLGARPMPVREVVERWRTDPAGWPSLWRARVAPRRLARLAGEWRGRRHPPAPAREIVVFLDHFPELSETFVVQEAQALRRLGHPVAIEASHRAGRPLPEAPDGLEARYAQDEHRAERALALAWLVARHPWRCLADVRSRERWRREEPVPPLRRLAVRARRTARRGHVHLHAHFAAGAALDAIRVAALLGCPSSVTAHAYDIYLEPRNLREKLLRAGFVTSGCDYTVADLRAIAGESQAGRVVKVIMGVDGEAFRRRGPLPGGRHVVAVGRLIEKKGFVHLVRAAARLDGVRVTIAGEGPLRGALEEEIARAGVGDRVRLAGAMAPDAVRDLLEEADVLAMPCVVAADGDRDSMPVVVKEALAMEVLVVASDEVGLPEIVCPPWGRLVPPGDDAELAAAIDELLALPLAERAEAGRCGREFVLRHCDVDVEAAKLATFVAAGPVP